MAKNYILLSFFILSQYTFSQIISIPDANFKNKLVNTNCVDTNGDTYGDTDADTNNDGQIDINEALSVTGLNVAAANISSLEGLQYFTNLTYFGCYNNYNITTLDLMPFPVLENLHVGGNNISELDVSVTPLLNQLFVQENNLTTLDVSNNPLIDTLFCMENNLTSLILGNNSALEQIQCEDNQLSFLDMSGTPNIRYLTIDNNNFTSIDVSVLPELYVFYCNDNQFESLSFPNNPFLSYFGCEGNNLTDLDLSFSSDLDVLYGSGNPFTELDLSHNTQLANLELNDSPNLTTINLKNGGTVNINNFEIANSPNLRYICVDEWEVVGVADVVQDNGYTNCEVNTYCTFEVGGDNYQVIGDISLDIDLNGCDTSDPSFPFVRIDYETNFNNGVVFANANGAYTINSPRDYVLMTPQLVGFPSFTIIPNQESAYIVDVNTPYIQDFCVTSENIVNDLDIVILPIQQSRPGFQSDFKIVYTNKGTTPLSGTITFMYTEEVVSDVAASPATSSQSANTLQWTFNNMLPFQSNDIDISILLNAPTDTPPLNGGDILSFTANITSAGMDQTPEDNTFVLSQTLVNSFDPNDKTCLNGDVIPVASIGEYLTYMIRFENTGTANATNVVVKDIIDTNSFDINSFVPLIASHDFVTRIINNNEVEFIFANIDLPFDDLNNDGYIVFKIKTVNTLIEGDTVENSASIYFDFNIPIITNTEVTTISDVLSIDDTEFDELIIYPNPTAKVLNIKSNATIDAIILLDINGRTLKHYRFDIPTSNSQIDLRELNNGIYFLNINTNKGTTNKKIIKR